MDEGMWLVKVAWLLICWLQYLATSGEENKYATMGSLPTIEVDGFQQNGSKPTWSE